MIEKFEELKEKLAGKDRLVLKIIEQQVQFKYDGHLHEETLHNGQLPIEDFIEVLSLECMEKDRELVKAAISLVSNPLDGERFEKFKSEYDKLSPAEKTVLELRYGIQCGEMHTDTETSLVLKMDVVDVYKYERSAIKRLAIHLKKNQLLVD